MIGTAPTQAKEIAMISDSPARPADRVPRPIRAAIAQALVLATLAGCAETPEESARPREDSPEPRLSLRAGGERFLGVAFRPDGRRLVATTTGDRERGSRLRLWDVASGGQVLVIEATAAITSRPAFSPDGASLAAGDITGAVRIWDAGTGRERLVLRGHEGPVFAVAVSPDGATLASGGQDSAIRLWDARTGQPLRTLEGHKRQIGRLAFSPDGKALASAGTDFGDNVRTWDVATGRGLRTLKGHVMQAHAAAFRPDGRQLASSSRDGIRLWDPTTGVEQSFLPIAGKVWTIALAYTPDGAQLLSSGGDGVVRLWDSATGTAVREFRADPRGIDDIAVSPDGRWIATAGDDGAVKLWDAPARERP
jgi:WD40 repeat protein